MNRQELIDKYGFKEMPYSNIMQTLILDLGRSRQLSISCLNTPNEMLFISEIDTDAEIMTDVVVLSNYDYDGPLTHDKLQLLLTFFNK